MNFARYTRESIDGIFEEFSSRKNGLTSSEAVELISIYGRNIITIKEARWWNIFFRQFKSPFIYLLLFAAGMSFWIGDATDGIIVIVFIAINSSLGFIEEYHSEHAVQELKKIIQPTARVKRNGKDDIVSTGSIVPGDVVVVETGDIIPADIRFFSTSNLVIDEGALTGESAPVFKIEKDLPNEVSDVNHASNIGFSGTAVVGGVGMGIVIATGVRTFMGSIQKLSTETRRESAFEKGIMRFSRFILRMIVIITILLFLANFSIKGGATNISEMVLFSLALAISVVPEALPVITTIALSRGAISLAKNKVVVRRLSSVEDLGSIEVLCTDKTGTITENRLTVADINSQNPEKLLEYAAASSSFLNQKKREPNNAFDLALWNKLSDEQKKEIEKYEYISEIPFDPEKKTNSVLLMKDGECLMIVRGAPEIILARSINASSEERNSFESWTREQGQSGKRAIAIGFKNCEIKGAYKENDEHDLQFLGAISFVDPIKPTAKEAILKAEELGVDIRILTGDGPEVAFAVGKQVGVLKSEAELITGDEFDAISDDKKQDAVHSYKVFARVTPTQKYRIIDLLQRRFTVGFLGEGINDSPALKLANVALVVDGAADIARDAADIVLLNQSLTVIVDGIKEGREIFANVVKYLKTTLISNFGNFYAVAAASLVLPYLPMLPIQILLLNLLSDFPMIAISTDNVDKSELRSPRSYEVREVVLMAIIFGLISTVFDFIIFSLFYQKPAAELQTNWFIGSVLTELALIYSMRTKRFFLKGKRPGKILLILCFVSFAMTLILPLTHFGDHVFKFIKPTPGDVQAIFVIVLLYFLVTEIGKLLYYRYFNSKLENKANQKTA